MARDFYVVLGLPTSATADEIHAAFRRRSQELDSSRPHSSPWLELQEAYSVLGDPQQRLTYDADSPRRLLRRPPAAPASLQRERGVHEVSRADASDAFRPSFDATFARLLGHFRGADHPRGERTESLTVEVVITPEEAQLGGAVTLAIPTEAACPACHGAGSVEGLPCAHCLETGIVNTDQQVRVEFPPALKDGHQVSASLHSVGIENLHLTVVFRVGAA